MGICTRRRLYLMFLVITILQIIMTGLRQISDFMGPLWALILSNFFNIVFCIFGFFGGYTRRIHFVIPYIVWNVPWIAWNAFIFCLYNPSLELEQYKSSVLSFGTGGFSYWETGASGCMSDWISETHLIVTGCSIDPNIVEATQASIQIFLGILGIGSAIGTLIFGYDPNDFNEKDDGHSIKSSNESYKQRVPAFLSLSRSGTSNNTNSIGRQSRSSTNRRHQRAQISVPKSVSNTNGDLNNPSFLDDKLRPMTPRKVKRRSARSIQSQRFGPGNSGLGSSNFGEIPGSSRSQFRAEGSSNRNSLRSNHSSRRSTNNHRSSKRKPIANHQQFISPINRLMQQQLDSETSHDEPRYLRNDQGHVNPVYVGPQSPSSSNPPPPPRPPSARSSYSNYHPARLPINGGQTNPNVFNLNQTLFINPAFDASEYNDSIMSSTNVNAGIYEDEVQFQKVNVNPFLPNPLSRPPPTGINTVTSNNMILHSSPPPPPTEFANPVVMKNLKRSDNLISNPTLVYPLAHSPVSQESFPMWGVAQAQVPAQSPGIQSTSSTGYPRLTHNPPKSYGHPPALRSPYDHPLPANSETVI